MAMIKKPTLSEPLTLCNVMDFSIHIDTSMGPSILYFKGSQVESSKL